MPLLQQHLVSLACGDDGFLCASRCFFNGNRDGRVFRLVYLTGEIAFKSLPLRTRDLKV
jgi:hypothetical protein